MSTLDEVLSGQVNSHDGGIPPARPSAAPLTIFGERFRTSRARVLSIGIPAQQYDESNTGRWPPDDVATTFLAGMTAQPGSDWELGKAVAYSGRRYAGAVLTYGVGASSHTVVFDWRPGVYQLPPCSFVSLGVVPYGTQWALSPDFRAVFAASCSPGKISDAPPPTVTTEAYVLGDGFVKFGGRAPAGSRAVDCYVKPHEQQANVKLLMTLSNGGLIVRDYREGYFWPPGPADCVGDLTALVVDHTDPAESVEVGVRFYLSL